MKDHGPPLSRRHMLSLTAGAIPALSCAPGLAVAPPSGLDAIARRLRELGFVNGEEVEVVAKGPLGAEPLLVQVGFTRFALRRSEAARIRLRNGTAA